MTTNDPTRPDHDDSRNHELSGFYRLGLKERRDRVAALAGLSERELGALSCEGGLSDEQADRMAENVLGVLSLPLGLCVHLRVDGCDRVVPMVTEEASVVAAASFAAKLLSAGGGVTTTVSSPHMIGQIQLLDTPDPEAAELAVSSERAELIALANGVDPALVEAGGGAIDLDVRHLPPLGAGDPCGPMVVVHLLVDVRDAMGANAINSMCERIAPRLAELSGGRAGLRILSNLADRRTVVARGRVPLSALRGRGFDDPTALARGIEEASVFAERDPYRAATHNKGIMNGVDAVLLAFGQDWRAVEAGAHAFAARHGRYTALARWRVDGDGLAGVLELPMAVGTVGGVARVHPTVKVTRKLAAVTDASALASVTAAVGLAQNLSALRALAAEGIQAGHMRLHARNLAVEAGASGEEITAVAESIARRGTVSLLAARRSLAERERRRREASRIPDRYAELRNGSRPLVDHFAELRDRHWPEMSALIDRVIGTASPAGSDLGTMCEYHLRTGGKRLRALLPLMVAEAVGVDPARLLPFGAACEMLHNATLVHDDLQDGDLVRRGRMTVWNRFGTPQAINLGDAMFYFSVLLIHELEVPAARREQAARRLLRETLRVLDGQEREHALKVKPDVALEDYFAMVEAKTSGLFALPMAGAAALCEAPDELVDGLAEAARHMGVLFQIQDDVLDLFGDKGREQRGSDVGEGKRSLLVVHALGLARPAEASWLRAVLDKPRAETSRADIDAVIALLEQRGSLAFALAEMRRRQRNAQAVPAVVAHARLRDLVTGMCELFLKPIAPLFEGRQER